MTKPKHRIAATCTSCQRNFQTTPAALLAQVACALNTLEGAGIFVRLKHGIVDTRDGYVLPSQDGWVARTKAYMPFFPADDGEPDDY